MPARRLPGRSGNEGKPLVKVFGVTGWSGSGKTTLLGELVPRFIARGWSVSTVKHAHHGFDLDQPGKDSWRHRQSGATEVLISSSLRWALMHELHAGEPPLAELLARLSPVDLVLVEGFKANPHPKLEVHRPALQRPPIWPGRDDIVAVAADADLPGCDRPVLPLNDPAVIVDWALAFLLRSGAQDHAT